jgi:signal transduction histidine kinase
MLSELPRFQTVYYCYDIIIVVVVVVVVVIIIIVSGSTVRVRTFAASQRRLRNLVKTLSRAPLDE